MPTCRPEMSPLVTVIVSGEVKSTVASTDSPRGSSAMPETKTASMTSDVESGVADNSTVMTLPLTDWIV